MPAAVKTSASYERRARRIINVRDFGARGNGVENDATAIDAAVAAMSNGSVLVFPPGSYLYSKTANSGNNQAAIKLSGLSRIGVVFDPGAELVLDTLTGGGTNGTRHGILVLGSCDDVVISGAKVRWDPVPASRTLGDGFRFLGYPGDGAVAGGWTATTGTIRNVQLVDCTAEDTPQTGAIFMGCTDVRVSNFRTNDTLADALHFNACRRVRLEGHTAVGAGDDGLALVTYYHATDVAQGTDGPFNTSALGEWNNGFSSFTNVSVSGGSANGVRVAGLYSSALSNVSVRDKASSGIVVDAGEAGGSHAWTYEASRGVAISNATVNDVDTGFLVEVFNSDVNDDERWWRYDLIMSGLVARDCANRHLRVQGTGTADGAIAGVSIHGFRGESSAAQEFSVSGVRECIFTDIWNVGEVQVIGQETSWSAALSGMPRHNLVFTNVVANGGKILMQDVRSAQLNNLRSVDSPTDGLNMTRCKEIEVGSLAVVRCHRDNSGTSRALLLAPAQQVRVIWLDVTHDNNTTGTFRSLELGGGDATNITEDVVIEGIFRNEINQGNDALNVSVQGGGFAPVDYLYDLRYYNGGEASPLWRHRRRGFTTWVEHFIRETDSPETRITAPVGSTCSVNNGGAGTSYYVKESGTGNTGWVGK